MIAVVVALGIWNLGYGVQKSQPSKPLSIQLQEKVYERTQPIALSGNGAVLDGHGATLQGKGAAVQIGAYGHVTVKNLKIVGFAQGVVATGATDLTLVNVSLAGCAAGFHLENVAGGLVQNVQAAGCSVGGQMTGCSKLIFEKCDLSDNTDEGLDMAKCSDCIVRDNRICGIKGGAAAHDNSGVGLVITNGSMHNQILRNVAAHCQSAGISAALGNAGPRASATTQTPTENTFQGDDVSWSGADGMLLVGESGDKVFYDTAGYCKIGLHLERTASIEIKGNVVVGNSAEGVLDENGTIDDYEGNVFVRENGGAAAMAIHGSKDIQCKIRVFQNTFMGYAKPLDLDNASPLTLQDNSFPWLPSVELTDIATVAGSPPLDLNNENPSPQTDEFVESAGPLVQIPTIFDRVGGVRISAVGDTSIEVAVEGSLSGAFQGEQEEIARYKGEMPIELTFPERFYAYIRVRQVGQQSAVLSFMALLGDNSIARHKPATDSGDILFTPDYAVDGELYTQDAWMPPTGKAGEWWEVNLKGEDMISAISVLPGPSTPNSFWNKFHIAVSKTGLFEGEETTVVTESDFSARPGPLRVYRFAPTAAHYIRLIGDDSQEPKTVQLKQFGVYGVTQ